MNLDDALQRINQLEDRQKKLEQAVEELSVLNEIASTISSTLSMDRIVEIMTEKCVKHLHVEQATVTLFEEEEEVDVRFRTMVRKVGSEIDVVPYRFDAQLTGWMLKHQQVLLINDLEADARFHLIGEDQFPFRSLLSVPLKFKGRLIGLLNAFNKKQNTGFTAEDQRLLGIIATQSAQIIENARLVEREQALVRMQEEVRLAYDIQTNLLPGNVPEIPRYDIVGTSIPAQNVGGDYYDFMPMEAGRWAISLGDAAGKGMPAALLMANMQATIRSQSLLNTPAGECLTRANILLSQSTSDEKFVTLFHGILDTEQDTFRYANAGHNCPFLLQNDSAAQQLNTTGALLGVIEENHVGENEITFHTGDVLAIYSDGITEALNDSREEFGEERLASILEAHRHESAAQLIDTIMQTVHAYAGETPQSDDMTLVVMRRIR